MIAHRYRIIRNASLKPVKGLDCILDMFSDVGGGGVFALEGGGQRSASLAERAPQDLRILGELRIAGVDGAGLSR
ncbi:MAG: hypothetical protein GY842_12525 [bacterium]|nr:hypothetical protein [bacterium]